MGAAPTSRAGARTPRAASRAIASARTSSRNNGSATVPILRQLEERPPDLVVALLRSLVRTMFEQSPYLKGPITEQRYTSVVGVRVICPAASAAAIWVSEVSCCGLNPGLKLIWTSCHSGLKPSPWIASSTLIKLPPAGSDPSHESHMKIVLIDPLWARFDCSPCGGNSLKLIVNSSPS